MCKRGRVRISSLGHLLMHSACRKRKYPDRYTGILSGPLVQKYPLTTPPVKRLNCLVGSLVSKKIIDETKSIKRHGHNNPVPVVFVGLKLRK